MLVPPRVLERRDRDDQVKAAEIGELQHVPVDNSGRALVLVDDEVAHRPVVAEHVPDLEHPLRGVLIDECADHRDLDRALGQPGLFVAVIEVRVAPAGELELPARAAQGPRQPGNGLKPPAPEPPCNRQRTLLAR